MAFDFWQDARAQELHWPSDQQNDNGAGSQIQLMTWVSIGFNVTAGAAYRRPSRLIVAVKRFPKCHTSHSTPNPNAKQKPNRNKSICLRAAHTELDGRTNDPDSTIHIAHPSHYTLSDHGPEHTFFFYLFLPRSVYACVMNRLVHEMHREN